MTETNTPPILDRNPINNILNLVEKFITRVKKSSTTDKYLISFCVVCAIAITIFAICYIKNHSEKWQVGALLLATANIILGTVAVGLFLPARTISKKIDEAKDIKSTMTDLQADFYAIYKIKERENIEQQLTEDEKKKATNLLETFLESLEKIYKKFFE